MSSFKPSNLQAIGVAVFIIVIQRVGFMVLGPGPTRTLFLDSLIVFSNCAAIASCFAASMRRGGVSRIFWLLFASAFAMQLVADVSWAYCRYFHIQVPDSALFPSLFYRLYAGPMAIALFLSEDTRTSKLESFFNGGIVVGLVGITMYQLQMAELSAHDPRLWQQITIGTGVNLILVLGALARFVFSARGNLHGLFARQTIYLLTYVGVALITSIGDAYFAEIDASIDLIWIVTYLTGAVLAITWNPTLAEHGTPVPRISRRASLLCFNLTLAVMVLGCTVLGLMFADSSRLVGLLAISVALISYAIRGSLLQDNQEKYLAALQDSQAQLHRQALYDELTGLPNRRLFAERLSQALAVARRQRHSIALVYFDLDGFKPVNDRLGHTIGDLLLNRAASRMLARVRKSDTLARMGGDEFTLLLSHLASEEHATLVAKELLNTLAEPFYLEGHSIAITASIGIGISPCGATDSARLIHEADSAMYAVKRTGGNGAKLYSPELG
ncbi:GGDEF domain-containing protein [Acidicapsa acidisoli]|uniref:GGDEF domain-containing protein n=1 Tax=Acidicapsa acidisoli TaxID=1615681 RepID=UPI0021DF5E0C|nr:GGDEF domain-containing protein [Acidicapsa acidisoli]